MLSTVTLPLLFWLSLAGIGLAQNFGSRWLKVTPLEKTVLPGENVTMLCKAPFRLLYCRIKFPDKTTFTLKPGPDTLENPSYYGDGLENGECGMLLKKVEEKHNGYIICTVFPELSRLMKLTVAKSPQSPVLSTSIGSLGIPHTYRADDELSATCKVADGRPEAKISWYLDDEALVEGIHHSQILDVSGTDLKTSVLNLTRRLGPSDNNRMLKCVAEHVAFGPQGKLQQQQLKVIFPPQPRENPVEIYAMKTGESGVINVTIRANPRPRIIWRIHGNQFSEGSGDEEGRIEALTALPVGNDCYNATLKIGIIRKEDTENELYLQAYNNQGQQEYTIRITALDEPQGIYLDIMIGVIPGVPILALIILYCIIFFCL